MPRRLRSLAQNLNCSEIVLGDTFRWSTGRSASDGSGSIRCGASCAATTARCGSAAGHSKSSACFASAEGAVVSKDELMARVWPGVVVEENNLHFQISSLRKALDADGKGESWIVTVPGRGYRMLRSHQPPAAADPAPGQSLPVPDKPSIAVLPFLNLSGDPEQEYFADGMVEEITTALSRI